MTDRITIIPAFPGCIVTFHGQQLPIIGWKVDQLTGLVDPITANGVIEIGEGVSVYINGFEQ